MVGVVTNLKKKRKKESSMFSQYCHVSGRICVPYLLVPESGNQRPEPWPSPCVQSGLLVYILVVPTAVDPAHLQPDY